MTHHDDPLQADVDRLAEYRRELLSGDKGLYELLIDSHSKQLAKKRSALDAYLLHGDGTTLKRPGQPQWVMILPDATEPGRYRYQVFSTDGFHSHAVFDTAYAAAIDAGSSGYTESDPDRLDQLATTPEWARGSAITAVIMSMNSRQITWQEGNERIKQIQTATEPEQLAQAA